MRRTLVALTAALSLSAAAQGASNLSPDDAALEARTHHLSTMLRCLVCQNQTLADSHADLALDLRNQVKELLRSGRSEAEVIDHLTARYGDFVVYKPPFRASTALLWAGPALLLLAAGGVLVTVLRRRARIDPAAFEAETTEDAA